MENKISPYYQSESSIALFKLRLIQHLDLLRMPMPHNSHEHECSRDCHIIERNHTLENIKHFLTNVEVVDK